LTKVLLLTVLSHIFLELLYLQLHSNFNATGQLHLQSAPGSKNITSVHVVNEKSFQQLVTYLES